MSTQRNLSIDLVRFIAAFGVVIIHLSPSTVPAEALTKLFSLFAVPFFLVISLYLFICKTSTLQPFRWPELHLERILIPYASWTLLYTLMRMLKFHLGGKSLPVDLVGLIFFGAAAVQLYFLPLLLVFQAQALAILFLLRGNRYRWIALCSVLGATFLGYVGSAGGYLGFNNAPARGLVYVSMAFLLVFMQKHAIGKRINIMVGCLIIACVFFTAFFGYPLASLGMLQGPLIGYGVAAITLNWSFDTDNSILRSLLTYSYGIYLAHFAFLESFEFILNKSGHALTPYSVVSKIVLGGLICLCCITFIKLARSHPASAYLLLGEGRRFSREIWNGQPKSQPVSSSRAV